jgi:hypothetical protein
MLAYPEKMSSPSHNLLCEESNPIEFSLALSLSKGQIRGTVKEEYETKISAKD